jgi:hypothetical protein
MLCRQLFDSFDHVVELNTCRVDPICAPAIWQEPKMNLDQEMPSKAGGFSSLDHKTRILAIGIPVVAAVVLMASLALQYFSDGTDLKPILGQWTAAENGWRITFHPDKSVDIGAGALPSTTPGAAPGTSSLAQGSFFPNIDGMVAVKMKDGKGYTAYFRDVTPDQFDLTDKETGHVIVFKRSP